MAMFYHHHNDNSTEQHTIETGDSTAGHDQLHHTFILMNPNFASGYPGPHQPQPPPPPQGAPQHSHNILLLNSAAATASHQFVRPMLPHQQDSVTLYGYPHAEAREITRPLSLSLSSSQQHTQYGTQPHHADVDGDVARSVVGSKYLKAAQELLEEVVNVGHGLFGKNSDPKWASAQAQQPGKGKGELSDEKADDGSGGGGDGEGVQLSSADRQELQMKKAKLVTMLDEAEQKYRQYHSQMLTVIHSFEAAAGVGSAKTYTALALKTISKQFRCLRDAIQGQIKAAGKSLGEGGGSGLSGGKIEGSRLKYIDHQIRQQRALQQLGVMQNHNAWRPQRGLPERSVSVLRAWLFEHFLHPYPKDSDKIMLAKQTGLTRSQVSNWFINARVRLWKPMIEDMYSEELKEQEQQNGSDEQKSTSHGSNSANNNQEKNTNTTSENQPNTTTLKDTNTSISSPSSSSPPLIPVPTTSSLPFKGNGFSFSASLETDHLSQNSPKRPRNSNEILHCVSETEFIKYGNDQKQERENTTYSILPEGMNFIGGGEELESYPSLGEMERFTPDQFQQARFFPGNGISLSLGLPPCENQQLNITATNHTTFLSPNHTIQFRRPPDFGSMNSPSQHSTPSAFECLDIQNRKGFAAPLLPDFVA